MPTYEYVCDKCGSRFEVFQKMSDKALTFCSHCNEDSLRRVFSSGFSINFKGAGFYSNDSKSSNQNKDAETKNSNTTSSSCSSCSASSCSSCHN